MKSTLLLPLIIACLMQTPHAVADPKLAADLDKIQQDADAQYKAAAEPVRKRHADSLTAFIRRATQAGDLETALRAKQELEKVLAAAPPAKTSPFVGEWEYVEGGRTYRRIVRQNGSVELWREGKVWMRDAGTPWWEGITWKVAGAKLEIHKSNGEAVATWELLAPDRVRQTSHPKGGQSELKLARDKWR